MKNSIIIAVAMALSLQSINAQIIDIKESKEYSPYIFGHNLEHTRAAINGGLSAQMLKNRKFAGKPSKNRGVASKWFGIGDKVLFSMEAYNAYTRHICLPKMRRDNERHSQTIQNLVGGKTAGIGQKEIAIQKGKEYTLRTVTKVSAPVSLNIELTNRDGDKIYARHTLSLAPKNNEWSINEFNITATNDDNDATLRYTFTEQTTIIIGALSMMPSDNFHGMRPDVVANLKAIGPKLLRWPGGNFAGEYRWKDGLLPVDERAPLQAATEIETQPYSDGYDYHEINTDDFIALCREVGAEPMMTINLAWSTPEESAEWIEYCNGGENTEYGKKRIERGHKEPYNVRFWSLGNEMGYSHMEGPKGSEGYASMAGAHADAMLKVTPGLKLFSSGPYPNDNWAKKSATVLADKVQYISLHTYPLFGDYNSSRIRYTTPEEIKSSYERVVSSYKSCVNTAKNMRKCLNATEKELYISYDEWNQWYAWYRPSCVAEGIFTANMMHFFLNESNNLGMPVVCYFQPVGEGAIIIEPTSSHLTANGQIFSIMKEHQNSKLCKITENDDYSTTATIKDDTLTITLINSEYDKEREYSFNLKGKVIDAKLYSSDEVTPYTYFTESPLTVTDTRKEIKTVIPAHSVALIHIKVK